MQCHQRIRSGGGGGVWGICIGTHTLTEFTLLQKSMMSNFKCKYLNVLKLNTYYLKVLMLTAFQVISVKFAINGCCEALHKISIYCQVSYFIFVVK